MLSKILKIFSVLTFLFLIAVISLLFEYRYTQNKNIDMIEYCTVNNEKYVNSNNTCFEKLYALMVPKLLTYKVKYKGRDVNFKIFPPSYAIPYEIARDTDVMLGYGVLHDMDAEEMYSSLFKKPSYGFDCGVKNFKSKNSLVHFESSCIATDEFILDDKNFNQVSSGDIHKFKQKLDELNLNNKKIIVKMDIAGAEYKALSDIIKYSDNVDIIAVAFHFYDSRYIADALKSFDKLSKDYVLIARSEHPVIDASHIGKSRYIKKDVNAYTTLTFVNKKIVDNILLSWKQISYGGYDKDNILKYKPTTISKIVVLNQKLKNLKERILNK